MKKNYDQGEKSDKFPFIFLKAVHAGQMFPTFIGPVPEVSLKSCVIETVAEASNLSACSGSADG